MMKTGGATHLIAAAVAEGWHQAEVRVAIAKLVAEAAK